MRKIFEEELQDLHVLFSEMGKMVNEAIYISVKGFVNHDKELAAEVIAHDVAINQREAEIEKRCFELIALHQPVTGNLRRTRFDCNIISINNYRRSLQIV